MDHSLILHNPELKLFICIANIVAEGTLSQNLYIGPGSFSIKFRKNIQRKITKSYPFFCLRIQNNTYNKNLRHSSLEMDVIYKH